MAHEAFGRRWAYFQSAHVPGGVQSASNPWGGMSIREDVGGNLLPHHLGSAHAARMMPSIASQSPIRWGQGIQAISQSARSVKSNVQKIRSTFGSTDDEDNGTVSPTTMALAANPIRTASKSAMRVGPNLNWGQPLAWPPASAATKSRMSAFQGLKTA